MRKTRLWTLLAALALVIGSLGLAACGDDDDDSSGGGGGGADLGTIEEGQLLVGTDTPYPPFEIGQPPEISGYDIEVMNAIAEELGVEVTYQDTGFDTIFRDTAQGLFDTAAAASTINPKREELVDFTDPYYKTAQAVLVQTDSGLASVDDLAGTIIGAQDATTGEEYANEELDAEEVRGFPEGPDAISALTTGQVDAVIIDQGVAADTVANNDDVEIIDEIETQEFYGFPVAPDNDTLREAMNDALKTIKQNGTLDEIYTKYFQTNAPASLKAATNEDLTND